MPINVLNLFHGLPETLSEEYIQPLLENGSVRIERIVSEGHVTAPGQWYDQEWDEWVLLLSGSATLRIGDSSEPLHLFPGDHILIPAHCRHRVEETEPGVKTVWLAVHYCSGTHTPIR